MIPGVAQFDGEGPGLAPSAAVANNAAASPVTAAQSSSMYSQGPAVSSSAQGTSPFNAAPKTIDKSNWNRGIRVPQATVDAVKDAGRGNMGVNAAKAANSTGAKYNGSSLVPNQPASPQYREAVTRVYPNAYAQAANQAASGRTNSPYGFGGVSQTPSKPVKLKPMLPSVK